MLMNHKPLLGWKIWYGDGKMVSSKEMSWEEAPSHNVQALILYEDNYYETKDGRFPTRVIMCANDYYYFHPEYGFGEVWAAEEGWADIKQVPDGSIIKYGKWLSDEAYEEIRQRAVSDKVW